MPAEMNLWMVPFAAALAVQIAYWMLLRRGFAAAVRDNRNRPAAPISVIVAARNEESDLPALLDALEKQNHPAFEVIVVDDGSTDGTAGIVSSRPFPGLKLIRISSGGKKRALAAGIDAAAHDLLAFTDADCIPPPGWLSALSDLHAEHPGSVAVGYSPFAGGRGLLARISRYETFLTGFLTAAAIGLGRPYMAVGRNLSYRRDVFRRVGGFAAIEHSMSGDDDLFLQEIVRHRAASVFALLDRRSFVQTQAPDSWRSWLRQKRRHVSGGRYYRREVKVHLALFHASGLLIWLAPAIGWVGWGMLAAKIAVQAWVLRRAAHVLGEEDQMRLQPFLEPLYVLYNLIVAPVGLAAVPKRW